MFRRGRIEFHVSVPLHLYLKYFSVSKRRGYSLLAGLDFNSDRVNMAAIDSSARVVAMKAEWFPDVTQHGFPKEKAKDVRVKKLKELLSYARRIGVDYIVFENLLMVKRCSRVLTPSGNRRITRFAKRQLLQRGLIMALKLGLTPVLIDPRGTRHSEEHERIIWEKGLDRHMASAYIIAYRGLKVIKNHEK